MSARIGGEGRALRALALAGMGLLGYAIGRAPAIVEQVGHDAATIAARADRPVHALGRQPRTTVPAAVAVASTAVPVLPPISHSDLQPLPAPRTPAPHPNAPFARVALPHRGIVLAAAAPTGIEAAQPWSGATAAEAPQALEVSDKQQPGGFNLATQAYSALAKGDRRGADRAFRDALVLEPDAPNAATWRAEDRRLRRRWSGQAWSLLRDGGGSLAAASPVLGGGQSGANIGYTLNPLSRRPLALVARAAVPNTGGYARPIDVAQFALGVEWQPVRGVRLSAERLIAGGAYARNDFALRLGAGASGERARLAWSGYGEAGVIGLTRGDAYAGGEARAGWHGPALGPLTWTAGGGVWGSAQWAGGWSTRFDAGPTLAVRLPLGRASLTAAADYRFRLAGNALPGSGPAVTLSTAF